MRTERITDRLEIVNADCYTLLDALPSDAALVTDPPYGIAFNYGAKKPPPRGLKWGSGRSEVARNRGWKRIHGDDRPFDPAPFLRFATVCLWGANNFASRLPDSRGWLVWDKLGDIAPCAFGDVELAWTNRDMSTRIHRQVWRGIVREGEENVSNGAKLHPAQKPVALLAWTLQTCGLTDGLVIDPFMGSGSLGVACHRAGLRYLGVEIDPEYYATAKERLQRETAQSTFTLTDRTPEPAPAIRQADML
jgi:site-specific DNA-methyltransferase (adenine-specific)/modification methylase